MEINEIPIPFSTAITDQLSVDLRLMRNHLQTQFRRARYAPSIITRSDAELLGISHPRFAIRIFLEGGSFVNCRRLGELGANARLADANQPGVRLDRADGGLEDIDPAPFKDAKALMEKQSCIADCLISPPDAMQGPDYHYITVAANLFAAYGEMEPANAGGSPFTSFVKSIGLGGGLCGQSVCFMATVILEPFAKLVCGIAEITAYAYRDRVGEIPISHITSPRMATYFRYVNLRITQQMGTMGLPYDHAHPAVRQVLLALESYLRSGFPVLFPTDARKMADPANSLSVDQQSIHRRNGWPSKIDAFPLDSNHRHTILFVGFRACPERRASEFIYHDPNALPYMRASAGELFNILPDHDFADGHHDEGLVIMPATPVKVKLPLLYSRGFYSGIYWGGLINVVEDISAFWETMEGQIRPLLFDQLRRFAEQYPAGDTRFQLYRLTGRKAGERHPWDVLQVDHLDEPLRESFANMLTQSTPTLVKAVNDGPETWLWIQSFRDSLWLWDAQREPLPSHDLLKEPIETLVFRYLRGLIYRSPKQETRAFIVGVNRAEWELP